MKEIQLYHGEITLVDDDIYDYANRFKWHLNGDGYVVMSVKTVQGWRSHFLHRLVMHAVPGMEVDHTNQNLLDNRRENLRWCTRSQNCAHKKKKIGCLSQYKGVHLDKRRNVWQAYIKVNQRNIFLGLFKNEMEAARIYDKATKQYFGEFALTNF